MLALHEQFIVDEKGKKTATIVPYAQWKKILEVLEEHEAIVAYDKAKKRGIQPVPFKKAIQTLRTKRS